MLSVIRSPRSKSNEALSHQAGTPGHRQRDHRAASKRPGQSRLPRAAWWTLEVLLEDHLTDRMISSTFLADVVQRFGCVTAGGGINQAARWRRLDGDTWFRQHLPSSIWRRRRPCRSRNKQEIDNDYPRSFAPPALMSAKTAALMYSGIWGQAATTSANSGQGSVAPRD